MKIWVDDIRPAPDGYEWLTAVDDTINFIIYLPGYKNIVDRIEEINLDHDAGDMYKYGGDYIEILNWLEEENNKDYGIRLPNCVFKFHSSNPVGVENMKRICRINGWRYE